MIKQFEFIEFVFDSVYVDLQYDKFFSPLLGSVSLCYICIRIWCVYEFVVVCCCLP